MTFKLLLVTVFLLASTVFGGCDSWKSGEYISVTPHNPQLDQSAEEVTEVTTNEQLRAALSDMVSHYAESRVISLVDFNEATVSYYVRAAADYVMKETPLGAYAVKSIDYEIGTNRDDTVVAVKITYKHSRIDVLGMQQASNMDAVKEAVATALRQNASDMAIQTENYEALDLIQFVRDYANSNPDLIMEVPKIDMAVYPKNGSARIVEMNFTYMTDQESLFEMQNLVDSIFRSAELYVTETTDASEVCARLYSFIMGRDEYIIETSITPAYSLLHHGVGDSRAFANIYSAMCRRAGVKCDVISGTRDGQAWCWNLAYCDGEYYHIDLTRSSESGGFRMLKADEMIGYVWDYSAYPS